MIQAPASPIETSIEKPAVAHINPDNALKSQDMNFIQRLFQKWFSNESDVANGDGKNLQKERFHGQGNKDRRPPGSQSQQQRRRRSNHNRNGQQQRQRTNTTKPRTQNEDV